MDIKQQSKYTTAQNQAFKEIVEALNKIGLQIDKHYNVSSIHDSITIHFKVEGFEYEKRH